jgi:hypothetical protein
MTGQIPIAVVVTVIGGLLLLSLMWYATTGPIQPSPLGGVVETDIPLRPLPSNVVARIPSLKNYSYFVEGDDVALVEPVARRVLIKIDIRQSGVP